MKGYELAKADWIITANQRQALDLQRRLHLSSTRVLTEAAFIERLWSKLQEDQIVTARWLSAFEQRLLWQRVIGQDSAFAWKQDEALTSACLDAWQWLCAWQVPLTALKQYANPNSEWFYRIAQRYQTLCREHQWIDRQQALTQLMTEAPRLAKYLPKNLLFYRFWQMSPALLALQGALAEHGIASRHHQVAAERVQSRWRYEAANGLDELEASVQWLCRQANAYPSHNMACVIPDLRRDRATIEYYLRRHADPKLRKRIHFSLGQPLFDYPLVQAAWRLINLTQAADVSLEHAIYLSHSPFWPYAESMEALVSRWRQQQLPRLPKAAWSHYADSDLQQWRLAMLAQPQDKAMPSVWQLRWQETLNLCGWPCLELSTPELAQLTRWQEALSAFAELDGLLGPLTQSQALHTWQQLLAHSLFEAPSSQAPQLIFIGLLEALGSDFDTLWLLDVTRYRWPNLPRANALIPLACQIAYHLPQATAAVALAAKQRLWAELLASADGVVVSHALWANGEAQSGCHEVSAWPWLEWHREEHKVERSPPLKPSRSDCQAMPCGAEESSVPGGTAALRAQANCAFQAFARYRLKLQALPTPELALTASERGLLVHHVLAELWRAIQNQQALVALDDAARHALIGRACQAALANLSGWRRQALPKTLLALELKRLERLSHAWLRLEAERPPFTVVQTEQALDVAFAGKIWRLRPDRVDRLASGELVLIDYKTGQTLPNWQSDSLVEPQLPFYALLYPEPISALVLAQVTARAKKMSGLAEKSIDCGTLGQIKMVDDWPAQLQQWYDALEQLATAYISGWAEVNPVKAEVTCQRCDLQAVCRIGDPHYFLKE